nr:hypothetical protein [Tanacetum cinerariifolium]
DLVESMLNHDSSIISSPSKIDYLLDEFAGKLTLLKSIPPGIDETDCHLENEIRLSQRLLYDNSSPRLPEEFNSENSNAEIESFSPSPIPNDDSDSFMEEIDLFLTPEDPMPPSIEDDEDSEGDILFERLLHDDPIPLPETLDFSYEEIDNSLSMGDEHLDTILAMELDEVIKSSVEDLVPIPSESEGIPDTMCDVHLVNNPTPLEAKDHFEIALNSNDDISSSDDDSLYKENIDLREKLLNARLLIANIKALKDNPTPSFEFLTKSSSTSPKSFLEETNTFHNSLPEFENFCFDLEEISSGSTTTHSDIFLPDYKAFYFDDDHIEEISNGSTTTHSYVSLF